MASDYSRFRGTKQSEIFKYIFVMKLNQRLFAPGKIFYRKKFKQRVIKGTNHNNSNFDRLHRNSYTR